MRKNVEQDKKDLKIDGAESKTTVKDVKIEPDSHDPIIKEYYNQIERPSSLGGVKRLYNVLKIKNKGIKESDVRKYLSEQNEYTLHKPITRKFKRNKVVVYGIDDTWQLDLVDMQKFSKENKDVTFILTVIDVFSKFAWAKMLKNKKQETVLDAFASIISTSGRKPKKIHSDEGTEFVNKLFKSYLTKQNIKPYITHSGLKGSVVERFNRTLKERMWRYFTQKNNNKVYYDVLPDFLESYNSSVHRSIKMTPNQVNKENADKVFETLYGYAKDVGEINITTPIIFNRGDYVRISKYKHIFSKGYERNWTTEVFKIIKIITINSTPVYVLQDLMKEDITGTFYTEELQKVGINITEMIENNEYLIEEVLKTKKVNGKKLYYVSWVNYPKSENCWIKESQLVK
jgi:transposase InsO family protein